MKCNFCKKDFEERFLESSHDVPCYLFKGLNRNQKKNKADKFPRHWLCKNCHEYYEEGLRISLIIRAVDYSNKFFGNKHD